MLAVTNGNSELAQVLVDHDAQVDCTDKHLRTALHRAVSKSIIVMHGREGHIPAFTRQLCYA